jgi:hypothetical protein
VRKLASVSLKEYSLKLPEGVLVLCRTFQSMRLHIHPQNTYDADGLKELLERKFLVEKVCVCVCGGGGGGGTHASENL